MFGRGFDSPRLHFVSHKCMRRSVVVLAFLLMMVSAIAIGRPDDYRTQDMDGPFRELFALGVQCYRSGNYQDALDIFMRCKDADERSPDVHHFRKERLWRIRHGYVHSWIFHCRLHIEPEACIAEFEKEFVNISSTSDFAPPIDRNLTCVLDSIEAYSSEFENQIPLYLELVRRIFGEDTPEYAYFLVKCGNKVARNSARAIDFFSQALNIYTREFGEYDMARVHVLDNMAVLYSLADDKATLAALYEDALQTCERTFGEKSTIYPVFYDEIIDAYMQIDNHQKAVHYLEKQYKLGLFPDFLDKSDVLFRWASEVVQLGDSVDGKSAYEQAVAIIEAGVEADSALATPKTRSLLVKYLLHTNRRSEAITYLKQEMEEGKVRNMGNCELLVRELYKENDDQQTLEAIDKWISIIEESRPSALILHQYVSLYKSLIKASKLKATIFINRNEYAKALQTWQDCLELIDRRDSIRASEFWQTTIHQYYYGQVLLWHAQVLNMMGLKTEAAHEIKDGTAHLITDFLTDMIPKSARDREQHWASSQIRYEKNIPILVLQNMEKESIETLYNILLFTKGLLLNTEHEMARFFHETDNIKELELYLQLQSDRRLLSDLEERPDANMLTFKMDSLRRRIRFNEKDLLRLLDYDKSNDVKNSVVSRLQTDWQEVRNALKRNEMAVEFVVVPFKADSVVYVALTLKKNYDSPHITILFEQHQLENLSSRNADDLEVIYNLVWQPLSKEFSNTERIYFSAYGLLHQLGIEHLPQMSSFACYRLSSTRELIRPYDHSEAISAVLYGGLQYELSEVEMAAVTEQQKKLNKDKVVSNVRSYRGATMGLTPLEGSRQEVETIAQLMCLQSKVSTSSLLMGENGTEGSFKALSGQGYTLLHLSTHGFYAPPEEREATSDESANEGFLQEDLLLSNSGLFMSGADNYLLDGQEQPDGNDGVLTAKEISRLDLQGLNMVVLSACETALGDVSKSEGVYGLQRGFKKAGAESILMSLWKVDDDATCMLMTEFYKNWIQKGKNKHDALQEAMKTVRSHKEKGWDEPKYWAAFILLDGLD